MLSDLFLRFLCIQNFREGRNYKVSRLEAELNPGPFLCQGASFDYQLGGWRPFVRGSQISALWTSLVAMKYHIMESTAFGHYAIFNYAPPVHYRRKTCTQTFKQVSVGFPKIGASPYIIPFFLPIGKYIYKTHGPCYLHRGPPIFFFRTGGQARRDHIYQEFERGGLKGPEGKARQLHHSSFSFRAVTPPVFFWMGVSQSETCCKVPKQKNPVVLDLKFVFFFGGELNSLKWAVIKTLGPRGLYYPVI